MTGQAGVRAHRAVGAILRHGVALGEVGAAVSQVIGAAVRHDALGLVATNPTAGFDVPAFSFWHGLEPHVGQALMHRFYAGDDPCPPHVLAQQAVPVGVVQDPVTPSDTWATSPRALTSLGIGGELRVLLRNARGVWGLLGLLRAQGARRFEEADVHRAAELVPALIAFLREHVTTGPLAPVVPAMSPGVVILGPDDTVRTATPQARAWHEHLRGAGVPEWTGTAFLEGLALYARRQARAPQLHPPVLVGPAATYGRWIACHAQPLGSEGRGDVAVVLHPATGLQVLPSFCDWYGITAREHQVLRHLLEGTAPKCIARSLGVSRNTVNDHIKAVFRKTGASGRDELLAALN